MASTLAYYSSAKITNLKSFNIKAIECLLTLVTLRKWKMKYFIGITIYSHVLKVRRHNIQQSDTQMN